MALSIPNRIKPGKNSFPTSPESVRDWLTSVQPILDSKSIKSLYRGLKHSNRLENSVRNRLEVAQLVEPAVASALYFLGEHFMGQSLPLLSKPAQFRRLHEALLSEFAITWKLIVNDTYSTLLPGQGKTRAIGIYKAIRYLTKLMECRLALCVPLPAKILEDGSTLYQFALKSNLTDTRTVEENIAGRTEYTIENAFAHMMLLALFDSRYQRLNQIPLICKYLEDHAPLLSISSAINSGGNQNTLFGIFLEQDSKPVPLDYIGLSTDMNLTSIDLAPLISALDSSIMQAGSNWSNILENETITRFSLIRLRDSFAKNKKRKVARAITQKPASVEIGLKEIATLLRYEDEIPYRYPESPLTAKKNVHWPLRTTDKEGAWSVVNVSRNGVCLRWKGRGTTNANTGEPIVLRLDAANADKAWKAGLVRWTLLAGEDDLRVGIEFLPGKISAARLGNPVDDQIYSERDCLFIRAKETLDDNDILIAPANAFSKGAALETESLEQYELLSKVDFTQAVDIFGVVAMARDNRQTLAK